jgi:hypothetical protein
VDGLRKFVLISVMLLWLASAKADPTSDSIELVFMANGRMFQSLNVVMTKDGRKYPVYYRKTESGGSWGYSYGQIAVELKNILYDADIAERIGADHYTTYDDLEITLFEVDNPFKVNRMMRLLEKEPMVRYAEISLIEDLNW